MGHHGGNLCRVRRLADELLRELPRIDVLVNNAGTAVQSRRTTPDGYESTFAVNHLAPYLLTRLLLDRIRESAPARSSRRRFSNAGCGATRAASIVA